MRFWLHPVVTVLVTAYVCISTEYFVASSQSNVHSAVDYYCSRATANPFMTASSGSHILSAFSMISVKLPNLSGCHDRRSSVHS